MHNGILYLVTQDIREALLPIAGSEIIVNLTIMALGIALMFGLVTGSALIFTLLERKVCAFIQVQIVLVQAVHCSLWLICLSL